jgi:hypothetical protein
LPADSEIEGILLAAIIGAAVAYAHQLWKYSKDAYHSRVDETCKLIVDIADDGAKYWSTGKGQPRNQRQSAEANDNHSEKLDLLEIQTEGRIRLLQFLRLMLQSRFNHEDRELLIERTANFQDATTGGDFAANVRASDPQRARQIYLTASDLIAIVRDGALRGNRLWLIVYRELERFLPYRRPTTRGGRIEESFWLLTFLFLLAVGLALTLSALWSWFRQLI